jgi:hypothetical protein
MAKRNPDGPDVSFLMFALIIGAVLAVATGFLSFS